MAIDGLGTNTNSANREQRDSGLDELPEQLPSDPFRRNYFYAQMIYRNHILTHRIA